MTLTEGNNIFSLFWAQFLVALENAGWRRIKDFAFQILLILMKNPKFFLACLVLLDIFIRIFPFSYVIFSRSQRALEISISNVSCKWKMDFQNFYKCTLL